MMPTGNSTVTCRRGGLRAARTPTGKGGRPVPGGGKESARGGAGRIDIAKNPAGGTGRAMKQITTLIIVAGLAVLPVRGADKPNIVYILADDLGYGDVHCLGGTRSKIATPNLDR